MIQTGFFFPHNEGHRSDCLPFTFPFLEKILLQLRSHPQWSPRLPRNKSSEGCETILPNQKVGHQCILRIDYIQNVKQTNKKQKVELWKNKEVL